MMKVPQPGEKMVVSRALWNYGRALAYLARRDRSGAARERDAFDSARAMVPADRGWGIGSSAKTILDIAAGILEARNAGSPAEEIPHWRKVVELQDSLKYDEPPEWYYVTRESLGAALLRAGQAADAEQVFRDALVRSPRNGRVLFGLMEALRVQQKKDGLEELQREFDKAWSAQSIKLTLADL
jgi:hypothetical protein